MRSPALAMGWEFRRRHLWALIAMAGYLLALAAIKLLFLRPMEPIRLDPPDGRAAVVITPLTATYFYLLAAFSFGLAGDLGARPSIYPARMFALPLRTAALVGWPMLYGTAAVAILWLVTALSVRWPWGIELPLIWPALLAAVFLAWTQALMWMPYGLPGLRAIVTVPWLATLDAVVLLAIHYRVREPMMVAFLAPQLPLAYVTACSAVGRARRGEVPDSYGVPPFIATRPLTSAELIAAKLKMAMWSTLAAWLLLLIALPLALEWSGTWSMVTERVRRMSDAIGTPRAATVVLLILAAFMVATWKQLVQSLHIGLTGREWIVKGSVLLTLTFLILLGPIVEWIIDSPSVQRALWNALPLILAGLVGLKMSAAAWIATRLDRNRLLGDRALVAGAACWVLAVLALYGVLVWFFSTPFVARYVLALIAILAVPLARISAAPLALAWNRHR